MTGKFLTAEARLEQLPEKRKWLTQDNLLYEYDDGILELTPRYLLTDNYTFPKTLALLTGDRSEYDVRPAHSHDLKCLTHRRIIIKKTRNELIEMGLLRQHKHPIKGWIWVCDDIPIEFLEVEKVTKWETDCQFKEMIIATNNIKKWRANMYRAGVFCNVGWIWHDKEIDLKAIYKEIIE